MDIPLSINDIVLKLQGITDRDHGAPWGSFHGCGVVLDGSTRFVVKCESVGADQIFSNAAFMPETVAGERNKIAKNPSIQCRPLPR
ncbi:hypothetical protein [Burkholderia ubonensis]|uniref:hypothetical protein n=1 Tax=Burkholderia ubonensis TaxID=101571 RepID=UPI0012F8854B|nr:hypothetical protein [Burkholderia ubonensis]